MLFAVAGIFCFPASASWLRGCLWSCCLWTCASLSGSDRPAGAHRAVARVAVAGRGSAGLGAAEAAGAAARGRVAPRRACGTADNPGRAPAQWVCAPPAGSRPQPCSAFTPISRSPRAFIASAAAWLGGEGGEIGDPVDQGDAAHRAAVLDRLGAFGGVHHQMHLAVLDHVDDVRPALVDLVDDLAARCRDRPGRRGAAGGEDVEAQLAQGARRPR